MHGIQKVFNFAQLKKLRQKKIGFLAQLVEQRIENPCVPGSIPGETTYIFQFALKFLKI